MAGPVNALIVHCLVKYYVYNQKPVKGGVGLFHSLIGFNSDIFNISQVYFW